MKKQLVLITLICLGTRYVNGMERISSARSPKIADIQFEHQWGNSLRFLGTTAIPLVGMSINGSNALKGMYRIITGELSETSLITTLLSTGIAIGCGYVTYEYSFKPYFKSEHGPFGYKRNTFKDAFREQLELKEYDVNKLDMEYLQQIKEDHPEEFESYLAEHKLNTAILLSLAPEEMAKDLRKAGKGVLKALFGK